jgi:hypothetical protein
MKQLTRRRQKKKKKKQVVVKSRETNKFQGLDMHQPEFKVWAPNRSKIKWRSHFYQEKAIMLLLPDNTTVASTCTVVALEILAWTSTSIIYDWKTCKHLEPCLVNNINQQQNKISQVVHLLPGAWDHSCLLCLFTTKNRGY